MRLGGVKTRLMQLAVILATAVLLASCGGERTEYRYRFTVKVRVSGEIKSGFSVIHVKWTDFGKSWWRRGMDTWVSGEAVFIDLDQGRHVVALLSTINRRGYTSEYLATSAFRQAFPAIRAKILDRTIVWQDVPGQVKLKGHLEPMLVTFSDVTDQDSVEVIQPGQFSSRFGSDVEFIGAWVEFTKDPVSVGIEDKLPLMRKNFDDSGIRKSGTFKLYKSMLKRKS